MHIFPSFKLNIHGQTYNEIKLIFFIEIYSKINDFIDKEPSILVSNSAFDFIH